MVMWAVDRFRSYGRLSGRGKLFWGQLIGIDETNTFHLTFFSSMKIVGARLIAINKTCWSLHVQIYKSHMDNCAIHVCMNVCVREVDAHFDVLVS